MTMLEASSDEEIELSLELSIGGSYGGKCEKPKQLVDESLCKDIIEEKGVHENAVPRSGFSFSEAVDQNRKMRREIQALKRREARRKREEKLRKCAVNFRGMNVANDKIGKESVWRDECLEAQQLQARALDREIKENESVSDDDRHELARSMKEKNVVACVLNNEAVKDSNFIPKQGSGRPTEAISSCQQKNVGVMQMKEGLYPPQSQSCRPLKKNGCVYRNGVALLACFGTEEENEMMKEKNMFQPAVACGSFRPYVNGNGDLNLRHNSGTGCDYSGNNSGGISRIANQKALSNGSLDRSSSAISDYRSTSGKGGSISDTGSHSSCLQANDHLLSLSATSDALNQPERNGPLNKREVDKETLRAANSPKQMFLSKEPQNCTIDTSGKSKPDTMSNAVTSKLKDTTSSPQKRSGEVADNPSKIQSQNFAMSCLPQMPCVSTTGNGPNGKTITGFLYRYTKTEISIVCVCHGSSFSPAEFVEHAGGIDITHPLRHITMIPSSFG